MQQYHIRRTEKEITDTAVLKKILKATQYVTIAMVMNAHPYLVSLSHGYNEAKNCLYFHCAMAGKKLDYLRVNNNVWGQAVIDYKYADGECTHLYASVHFSGNVTFLEDRDEKRIALELMIQQLDPNPEDLVAGLTPTRLDKVVMGRIDIKYLSGKKSNEVTL